MNLQRLAGVVFCLFAGQAMASTATSYNSATDTPPHVALSVLETQAHARVSAKPRVALAPDTAALLDEIGSESLEPAASGHVPNYLRAIAVRPGAAKSYAHFTRAVLYKGTVEPEIKMAMGLRMAQMNTSPYVAAHVERLLRSSERGRKLLSAIGKSEFKSLPIADLLALHYADWLSPNVNGVSDANYREVRGYYTDSEIVELTFVVCYFNYFTRLAEGLNLPVEPWVFDSPAQPNPPAYEHPMWRVQVISEEQLELSSNDNPILKDMRNRVKGSLGLNIANSERAMLWSPEIAQAWWTYGRTVRQTIELPREMMLQVSFAVSMANGCRYCILHQVLGLRKQGISAEKLVSMRKDDSSLTPREFIAVQFARALTRNPPAVSDTDYDKLKAEFGDTGALDILFQACTFAFMNRFTDGLKMPSEDVAVQTYREVYGADIE
jgi:AhpD family alkylhydroperoxidase